MFLADTHPDKMNLGVGAYRDDNAKPVVLDCVREAERRIAGKNFMEYLPTNGNTAFVRASIELAYGENAPAVSNGTVAAIQTLSGTGSCRLMADFMHRFAPGAKVYIPVPTWSNHHNIWKDAGCEERTFRYYKAETRGLDFEGMMEDINNAEPGSFFLLHACAHNPTGVDPSVEQWRAMSAAMKRRGLFPFFDMAYQAAPRATASATPRRSASSSRTGTRLGARSRSRRTWAVRAEDRVLQHHVRGRGRGGARGVADEAPRQADVQQPAAARRRDRGDDPGG